MEGLNRDKLEDFLFAVIEKSKKGKLTNNVKVRISYDVITPLFYYHDIEKASNNFLRLVYNIKRGDDGMLFVLPEGVL